jgi:hypothetical protein
MISKAERRFYGSHEDRAPVFRGEPPEVEGPPEFPVGQ